MKDKKLRTQSVYVHPTLGLKKEFRLAILLPSGAFSFYL